MANVLHLKIAPRYINPPIWRRVEVPDTLIFWELHFVLQILFDWENSHLFEFRQGWGSTNDFLTGSPPVLTGDEDNMPEWQLDPRQVALDEVLRKANDKLTYVYDFGDYWEHDIVVEKVIPLLDYIPLPAVRCWQARRPARRHWLLSRLRAVLGSAGRKGRRQTQAPAQRVRWSQQIRP